MSRTHNEHARITSIPGTRKERIEFVQKNRWQDLELILEEIDDPHNIGAILRTCEAVGISNVHFVYNKNKPPRISELSSSASSAAKWLNINKWNDAKQCIDYLHAKQLKILVTALDPKGKPHFVFNLSQPIAIVMGNEKNGISEVFKDNCDGIIAIPMRGFVQSLNVSVAAAVVLYEVLRQRTVNK